MKNFKQSFIEDIQNQIDTTRKNTEYALQQINVNLPKRIADNALEISNLKELLRSIEISESFSDPVFSYVNDEYND